MATSPFKRRPNPTKTYAKRSTADLPTARPRPASASGATKSKSDVAKLLMDSSEGEQDGDSSASEAAVGQRLLGRTRVEGRQRTRDPDGARNPQPVRERKRKSVPGEAEDTTRTKTRRTSSVRTKPAEKDDTTTVWDEKAVIGAGPRTRSRRSEPTRQSTAGNASASSSAQASLAATEIGTRAPSTRRTSPRKSAPTSSTFVAVAPSSSPLSSAIDDESIPSDPPSPPYRKHRKISVPGQSPAPTKHFDGVGDNGVPPPFDYVPSRPRLRSSPSKARSPSEPESAPTTCSAPVIRTVLPSSSSPRKYVERTPPPPTYPLPSPVQALRPDPLAAELRRPPSPAAKDLSSLFSSFSKVDKTVTGEVSGPDSIPNPLRGMIRRNTSGGIVASLSSKRAGEGTARTGTTRATTPVTPERPTRAPLDRSFSQPSLSSPLSSPNGMAPFRSPLRTNLVAASSLPGMLSPQRSRSGSASPTKDGMLHLSPAIGSVYRPVSFSASASATLGFADGGRTRTYGGARSIRLESEHTSLSAETRAAPMPATTKRVNVDLVGATSSTPHLPTLPPSISQRLPKTARPRETYSQLREKWGITAEEDLDESEEHESLERGARVIGTGTLRAQGEGKRWSDEMGWTLDGLREGKGGSGARSSAIELLGKTLDREWMRRLKSSGMAEQVYLAFRRGGAGDGDRVLDVALVVLLAAFARDQRLTEPLFRLSSSDVVPTSGSPNKSPSASQSPQKENVRNCEVLETLVKLTTREWALDAIGGPNHRDAYQDRPSKTDARHLQSLRDIIDQSNLFSESHMPVTLRTLLLQVFRSTASFSPRPIFQPQLLLCTSGAFAAVVETFLSESAMLSERIDKYTEGLEILPPSRSNAHGRTVSPPTISICMSIFEATSVSTPYAFQLVSSDAHFESLSAALCEVSLFSSILTFAGVSSGEQAGAGPKLLLSVLGILFGLSTEPIWGDALLHGRDANDGLVGLLVRIALACRRTSKERPRGPQHETLEAEDDTGDDRLDWDTLCLVLGILTNLVESADGAKDILRETKLDPDCHLGRNCARSCGCPSRQPALTILAQIYLDPLEDAPNSVHQTSVAGFLRLLLGLAVVDNPRNETLVVETLGGSGNSSSVSGGSADTTTTTTTTTNAIGQVIDALDEFAKLHEEQARVLGGGGGRDGTIDCERMGRPSIIAGRDSLHGEEDAAPNEYNDDDDNNDNDDFATMEVVGQTLALTARGTHDGSDVADRIRSTIARLKRRTA